MFASHNGNKPSQDPIAEKKQETIVPGGNKAVLKLSDGTEILLDSAGQGTLAQQGSAKVIKLNDGQLSYQSKGTVRETLYNTITTPKGGQYQLVLADGSKVWLNASSSLRFPVVFSGEQRLVELTGEGYFEITKNERMPFHVQANGVDVKVIGTHFNVNAYTDESATRTTLLEGMVSVAQNNQTRTLRPGQQAAVNNAGMVVLNDVDIEEVVAWKNGMFQFKSADIGTILRQAERWYDVHFVYEGEISKEPFSGQISRNVNADQLLKILEIAGKVKFEATGRTIVVKPTE